jgi:protein-tyrosine phosphatase
VSADRYRIVFVCLGNICRSPMAEVVMQSLVERADLADQVEISSAGTGDWHVGERADPRTVEILAARGYDGSRHRARQFEADWFDRHDLVVALDSRNFDDLRRLAPADRRDDVRLLRSYIDDSASSAADMDVPDPYYGGPDGFGNALTMVEDACSGLLRDLRARLGA